MKYINEFRESLVDQNQLDEEARIIKEAVNLPVVLILKRKAIRNFPDGQVVGLYYSDQLDKFVTVPHSTIGMSEDLQLAEVSNREKARLHAIQAIISNYDNKHIPKHTAIRHLKDKGVTNPEKLLLGEMIVVAEALTVNEVMGPGARKVIRKDERNPGAADRAKKVLDARKLNRKPGDQHPPDARADAVANVKRMTANRGKETLGDVALSAASLGRGGAVKAAGNAIGNAVAKVGRTVVKKSAQLIARTKNVVPNARTAAQTAAKNRTASGAQPSNRPNIARKDKPQADAAAARQKASLSPEKNTTQPLPGRQAPPAKPAPKPEPNLKTSTTIKKDPKKPGYKVGDKVNNYKKPDVSKSKSPAGRTKLQKAKDVAKNTLKGAGAGALGAGLYGAATGGGGSGSASKPYQKGAAGSLKGDNTFGQRSSNASAKGKDNNIGEPSKADNDYDDEVEKKKTIRDIVKDINTDATARNMQRTDVKVGRGLGNLFKRKGKTVRELYNVLEDDEMTHMVLEDGNKIMVDYAVCTSIIDLFDNLNEDNKEKLIESLETLDGFQRIADFAINR